MAHQWKNIGLALRLRRPVLDMIHANYSDVEGCLEHVLTEWLNKNYNIARFGEPSWQLLVAAVAHPVGGNNPALAHHIAIKYNGKCIMLNIYIIMYSCTFTLLCYLPV